MLNIIGLKNWVLVSLYHRIFVLKNWVLVRGMQEKSKEAKAEDALPSEGFQPSQVRDVSPSQPGHLGCSIPSVRRIAVGDRGVFNQNLNPEVNRYI